MDINKANLTHIQDNNINYSYVPAQSSAQQAQVMPAYQYQYYQYPAYSPESESVDINTAMKSQVLPPSREGYKEVMTFDAPFLNKGKLYKLDNGQNLIVIPKKGPTTIKTFVKVGSFNEAKNRGISHYIEHNLFNGSSQLGPNEFVEKVVNMGGQYNASTNTNTTDYYIKSPMHNEGDFEKFAVMHADMLQNPKFTEKMLEKERGPVISEIQMYEDDPYDKAYNLMLKNLFGIKADYQGLIAGSSKNIAALTRNDVVDYYNEWYRPDNMTTVVVGEVDPTQTVKTLSKLFNQKKSPAESNPVNHFYEPINLIQSPKREDFNSPHVDAVSVNMAFAGPANNNIKDSVAAMALCSALTGYENARLVKTLKEFDTGGSVDVNTVNPNYNDPQLITFGTTFTPGREEEGLKAVYKTMQEMATQPVNEKELFIIKNSLKNNFAVSSEDSMAVANMAGKAITETGSINAYTGILNEIDNLTPQDIQDAAQKYLDLNRTSIVMVHPQNKQIAFGASNSKSEIGFKTNTDKFKLKNIKEYDLSNNLRVAINDDPDSIRTSADLSVQTDDIKTIKPGVVDILTIMLNKGTKNYSEEQLNNMIDTYNLGIVASATGTSVDICANCPKERLPMAVSVMKEIINNPDLTQEKFNKAKEELKVQLSGLSKDPADRAAEILFPEFNRGNSPRKILTNIDKVTLDDVKTLHSQIMSDSQGKIAIDGAISKTKGLGQELFMQLQSGMGFVKSYHSRPDLKSQPLQETRVVVETEPRNQADIIQMFKIKQSKNIKDEASLAVLNEVLGGNSQSRLFTDLRESQKLAYKVKSIYSNDGDYGVMKLLIKTTTEDDLKGPTYGNVQKSLDGFKNHINTLKTVPVNDEELERAKLAAKTRFLDPIENSSGRAGRIQSGYNTLYGADYHNQMIDTINNINSKDIQNAANLYLGQPSVISMIASSNTVKAMSPYLSSFGKVEEAK